MKVIEGSNVIQSHKQVMSILEYTVFYFKPENVASMKVVAGGFNQSSPATFLSLSSPKEILGLPWPVGPAREAQASNFVPYLRQEKTGNDMKYENDSDPVKVFSTIENTLTRSES